MKRIIQIEGAIGVILAIVSSYVYNTATTECERTWAAVPAILALVFIINLTLMVMIEMRPKKDEMTRPDR